MALLSLALALVLAAPGRAARAARADEPELVPVKDNWTATQMEAKAIMGELKYQHGDLSGARATFRDSLNSSARIVTPHDGLVSLDLYRAGELAAREGDFGTARRYLELLVNRYPDSEWSGRGLDLLEALPRPRAEARHGAAGTGIVIAEGPEQGLMRVRAALLEDRGEEALAAAREFLRGYPKRPEAPELRLLEAALVLRAGSAGEAARLLEPLAAGAKDAELRAKAFYLLGAARLALGEHEALRASALPGGRWGRLAGGWRAASEARLGRHDEAARLYRAALAVRADSPLEAYLLAGLAASEDKRGRPLEAARVLERAEREAARWDLPDLEAAAQLSRAHMLYRAGRFEAARAAYGRFLARQPGHPQRTLALYQSGLAAKRLGRPREALGPLKELAERHPDSVYAADAHLQLGQILAELGASDAAIGHYREMGRAGGAAGETESLLLSAQVHYNAKRFRDAIPLYRRFLEQNAADPRRREVAELLLNAYWLGDRDDPALPEAALAHRELPIAQTILWGLALKAEARDPRKAADLFAHHGRLYPKSPRAAEGLVRRADCLERLGLYDQALAADDELVRRFPGHAGAAGALLRRGLVSARAGRRLPALSAYEAFLTRFPAHAKAAWAWQQVGGLREALGRFAPAAAAYAHVPAGDPNRVRALYGLARCRERAKDAAGALKAYEALRAEAPAGDSLRLRGTLRLALLHELGGRRARALPLYGEVLRRAPAGGADFETARARLQALTAPRGR